MAPGAVVTATIANGPGNLTDWVGLFATGGPSANPLELEVSEREPRGADDRAERRRR